MVKDRGGGTRATRYACIECNRDYAAPTNEHENMPCVQNATSGTVNSQAFSRGRNITHSHPAARTYPFRCSKEISLAPPLSPSIFLFFFLYVSEMRVPALASCSFCQFILCLRINASSEKNIMNGLFSELCVGDTVNNSLSFKAVNFGAFPMKIES